MQSSSYLPEAVSHLWVDPHYGDNTQATANNPTTSNMCPGTRPPTYPDDVIDTQVTLPWADLWGFEPKPTASYYEPELTDITPHLLPDIHPYWHGTYANKPCNPIWQHCMGIPLYNPTLYQASDFGVINPPGTYEGYGTDFRWLDGTGTAPAFTAFSALGGPVNIDFFDDWCRARENNQPGRLYDTFPDYAPAAPPTLMISRRYSLEYKQKTPWRTNLDGSNVQSFFVLTKTF